MGISIAAKMDISKGFVVAAVVVLVVLVLWAVLDRVGAFVAVIAVVVVFVADLLSIQLRLMFSCFLLRRVRELEGKVRELENSMARMGAQQDVNMELIGTFRLQKEAVSTVCHGEGSYCGTSGETVAWRWRR